MSGTTQAAAATWRSAGVPPSRRMAVLASVRSASFSVFATTHSSAGMIVGSPMRITAWIRRTL